MEGVKFVLIVTRRDYAEEYMDFLKEIGAKGVLRNFCRGATSESVLQALGLERVDRIMFRAIVSEKTAETLRKKLITEMRIAATGNGFMVIVSADSLGGASSKNYFLGDAPIEKGEKIMEDKSKFVLLITIADKGNVDTVMDAAKEAGATGGTVVSGKGTGTNIAKFFGATISEEKDMVYIVAKRENRDAIMKAIMEKAGRDTEAHGIVFSLPVDEVAGIGSFIE